MKQQSKAGGLRSDLIAYSMILPGMGIFIGFVLVPFIQTILISFTDWNGMMDSSPVGLANYI